jgi:hypothetical protein
MATPGRIFQTYNQVGIREDLQDIIYDISPMDTIAFTRFARMKANNTLHDWQTDALAAPNADNAYIEGDDFSAQAITGTTKLRNYTQISRKDVVVSRTANKVNTAGRKEELAYQMVKRGKEMKRDIESAILQNKAATSGGSASARVSASVETWIHTNNHVHATGQGTGVTTPAPVNGIAADAPTDGSATALISSDFNAMLQQAWSCGGEVDTVLVGAILKAKIDNFTSIATRFRNVGANSEADIVAAADVYVSDFGNHKVVLSRFMRTTVVLALDMSTWGIAWLDPIHTVDIAKAGDSEKKMIVGEWTLVAKSPTANAKLGAVN